MLKTIQIIKYLKNNNYSKSEIFIELANMSDNYTSDIFDLSLHDYDSIHKVFNNDDKLKAAFNVANLE
jgi:hypothetical protein